MKKSKKRLQHISPEILKKIAEVVESELGLDFRDKTDDLKNRLRSAFRGLSEEEIEKRLERLLKQGIDSSPELINHLTIPETYFLRNGRLFDRLEFVILPEIISRKQNGSRRINIWSAGCSTGEEPYSVSVLMNRLMPDQSDWQITILATDVNETKLKKARNAVYTEWSFRNTPLTFKDRYFDVIDLKHYRLKPVIKERVTFLKHNLKKDPFPPDPKFNPVDLIICRNVLMYLSGSTVISILHKFYALLEDDGYFITGAGEFPALKFDKFKPQIIDGIIVYRKRKIT
ncbi:MAG: protein-glutamate O-methyltransferase CheR, partial [Calditrichaeota bacterium]|nr:protein-glutamate O-methyltransferase CheR [Calditrichota bacterium]